MTVRPAVCQRQNLQGREDWWYCEYCGGQSWNERDSGHYWRPYSCPDRKKREGRMLMESLRDEKNHDGGER